MAKKNYLKMHLKTFDVRSLQKEPEGTANSALILPILKSLHFFSKQTKKLSGKSFLKIATGKFTCDSY
jgi:hypothetical protein